MSDIKGNEDDYVIISLVRTKRIGFMRDRRRTNVMLTRLKKGMVIVTNQIFLENEAVQTLVGTLAEAIEEIEENVWYDSSVMNLNLFKWSVLFADSL